MPPRKKHRGAALIFAAILFAICLPSGRGHAYVASATGMKNTAVSVHAGSMPVREDGVGTIAGTLALIFIVLSFTDILRSTDSLR